MGHSCFDVYTLGLLLGSLSSLGHLQPLKIGIISDQQIINAIGNISVDSLFPEVDLGVDIVPISIDHIESNGDFASDLGMNNENSSGIVYFSKTCRQTIQHIAWVMSNRIPIIVISELPCWGPKEYVITWFTYPGLCHLKSLIKDLLSWKGTPNDDITLLMEEDTDVHCILDITSDSDVKLNIFNINTSDVIELVSRKNTPSRYLLVSSKSRINYLLSKATEYNIFRADNYWIILSNEAIDYATLSMFRLNESNIAFVSPTENIMLFYLREAIQIFWSELQTDQPTDYNKINYTSREFNESHEIHYDQKLPNYTVKSLTSKSHGGGHLVQVGTWSSETGMLYDESRLFPNEFLDFRNRTLKIGAQEAKPFNIRQKQNGTTRWTGFCFNILDELAKGFNFKYEVVEPPDGKWGAPNEDGTWNGIVGMVKRGDVHFGVGPFTITSIRETVIDFTKPFMEDGAGILTRKPENNANKMFQMFKPFAGVVWIFIGVSVIVVGVLLYITNRFSPFTRYNRREKFASKDEIRLLSCMWLIYAFFMEQGGEPLPSAISGRCILGFWWIFTILIMSTYTANLAAFLTVTIAEEPINSLEELVSQSKIKPVVKTGTNLQTLFKSAEAGIYKTVWGLLGGGPEVLDATTAIEMVRNGDYAYMTDNSQLEFVMLRDCQTFALSKEMFNTAGYGFVLPENAPFLDHFNQKIMRMQEAGLVEKWHQQWWTSDIDSCLNTARTSSAETLALDSLSGVFFVYIAVVGISLISLGMEMAYLRCRYNTMDVSNTSSSGSDGVQIETLNEFHLQTICKKDSNQSNT